MTKLVFTYSHHLYFRAATIVICWGTCLAFLLVATSNPGVVTEEDFTDSEEESNPLSLSENSPSRKRLCRKCNIRVSKGTFHCSDCDVCIKDFDHHCPWTSKCIGGGNLKRFYTFLVMVPIYLIYIFVAFSFMMSNLAIQSSSAHLKGKHHFLFWGEWKLILYVLAYVWFVYSWKRAPRTLLCQCEKIYILRSLG